MGKRRKVAFIVLFLFLIIFFIAPYVIPIPNLTWTFPSDMLDKEDSKFIAVNGLKVHYKIYGSGEPVVILMHGFGAYSFSFDPVIKDLSSPPW
ncbi:MAG: alpha/beta fold hydrolase [Candidatus Methanomethylicaceae archaeon]